MASRVSGWRWIFGTRIESGPDHHVQNAGEAHESSADAESFNAAEKFRRNLARNDSDRDAANQDYQAGAAGADRSQLSDIRWRPSFCHDKSPIISGSGWKIRRANISPLQLSAGSGAGRIKLQIGELPCFGKELRAFLTHHLKSHVHDQLTVVRGEAAEKLAEALNKLPGLTGTAPLIAIGRQARRERPVEASQQ